MTAQQTPVAQRAKGKGARQHRLPKGAQVDRNDLRCPCQDYTGLGHCICDDDETR